VSWTRAEVALSCGGCDQRIAAGEPVRWVFQRPRCTDCAARMLDEAPPADLDVPEARERLRLPSSWGKWDRAVVDGRMRRAGRE
jgi:hypothetical protein